MVWLETGGNAGALMPVSDTGHGRPAFGERLRSTLILRARAAWCIVQSGHSVVVQVWSMPEGSPACVPTIRVWVCNGDSARAVEAKVLEQNLQLDGGESAQTTQTRFATGWIVTGEPGGAHRSQ